MLDGSFFTFFRLESRDFPLEIQSCRFVIVLLPPMLPTDKLRLLSLLALLVDFKGIETGVFTVSLIVLLPFFHAILFKIWSNQNRGVARLRYHGLLCRMVGHKSH